MRKKLYLIIILLTSAIACTTTAVRDSEKVAKVDKKIISEELMFLNQELQLEILKGIFRGDGYFTDKLKGKKAQRTFALKTVSKQLAYQIQWLLLRNRIKCSFYKENQKSKGGHTTYKIEINGLEINKLKDDLFYIDKDEIKTNVRLSCQVKVRNDLKIRIPEEIFNIQQYNCKCEEIRDLTYDIKLFRFRLTEPSEIKYVPGQYMQLFTLAYEKSKEEVYRAYSIASDPAQKNIIDFN